MHILSSNWICIFKHANSQIKEKRDKNYLKKLLKEESLLTSD